MQKTTKELPKNVKTKAVRFTQLEHDDLILKQRIEHARDVLITKEHKVKKRNFLQFYSFIISSLQEIVTKSIYHYSVLLHIT